MASIIEGAVSYEGYIQKICLNGHYWTIDAYAEDSQVCPVCGGSVAWSNGVDLTNGSFESCWDPDCSARLDPDESCEHADPLKRIDGFIPLRTMTKKEFCTCRCGNVHTSVEPTFFLPSEDDLRLAKPWLFEEAEFLLP